MSLTFNSNYSYTADISMQLNAYLKYMGRVCYIARAHCS